MPRQNRVTPFGDMIATPDRGTFMGNRGVLHDDEGRIRRAWQVKRWLVCVLEFRGRKRTVMTPNRYTELFFLDEATALAAGHRPCAECRHGRFLAFCNAWRIAHPTDGISARPTADEIDRQLHAERLAPDRSKRSFTAALDGLPDGVFVTVAAWGRASVPGAGRLSVGLVAGRLRRATAATEGWSRASADAEIDRGDDPSGLPSRNALFRCRLGLMEVVEMLLLSFAT